MIFNSKDFRVLTEHFFPKGSINSEYVNIYKVNEIQSATEKIHRCIQQRILF